MLKYLRSTVQLLFKTRRSRREAANPIQDPASTLVHWRITATVDLVEVSKGSLRLSCTTLQKLLQMKNEVIPSSPRRQSTVGAEHKTKPEPSNHSRTSPLLHPLKITRCT